MKLAETPAWVVLQLVEECNLRCTMCYQWGESGVYHGRELATLDTEIALRVVRESLPWKPYFELFGGEPLLHPGIWDIVRAVREGGCEIAFPTNGTLLLEHADRLVEAQPTRVWVSLDGPEAVNDAQRGHGVWKRVMRGLAALFERRRGAPEVGLTCVVTPANHLHIEELFLQAIDLGPIGSVSIELQSWATEEQHRQYARLLREEFGVPAAPHARAYVRDPARFALMDRAALSRQLERVRAACVARGIRFYSQPKLAGEKDLDQYLRGDFAAMAERKSRCAFPWTYAEISARGDVATCHTFYDLPLGNVREKTLLQIWRGEPLQQLRAQVRKELLPICTACCRYWQ